MGSSISVDINETEESGMTEAGNQDGLMKIYCTNKIKYRFSDEEYKLQETRKERM